ncbi:hypothetical protein J4458_07575 [Candidatus Woesearchaeota archaeon]|nr:hypothetical protein [Candidatus Woesearchaeota archaeon]
MGLKKIKDNLADFMSEHKVPLIAGSLFFVIAAGLHAGSQYKALSGIRQNAGIEVACKEANGVLGSDVNNPPYNLGRVSVNIGNYLYRRYNCD